MSCCGAPKGRRCGCCDESYQMLADEKRKRNAPNPCIDICQRRHTSRSSLEKRQPKLRPKGLPQVTLDGKLVPSKIEYYEEHPFPEYPPPPWILPRLASRELRGGTHYIGCDCYKKNGLQDDCQRMECGVPPCTTKPDPCCDNSRFSPTLGIYIPYKTPDEYC
uniref:Uncharacterized protein n=1 Tax=Clastoptera arizonana TaxID=38151 RepID=A0A1B6C761_9HEMI